MWEVFEKATDVADSDIASSKIAATLVLDFDQRQKCRMRVITVCGKDVGIFLSRGESLHDKDVLKTSDGAYIRVVAAPEALSTVICEDMLALTRAAYHLGNRHVPLQILPGILRYQSDYVLDDMVRQLGLEVNHVQAPFQPEKGAYHSQGGHSHGSHSPASHLDSGDGRHAHGQRGSVWKAQEWNL